MTAIAPEHVIKCVGTLPPLPITLHRLVKVASDPASTLEEIVEAIRYDPGITAEVLRLCNSAYFGLPRTVESLDRAVCLLGTVKVFQLVMAANLRSLLHRPLAGYGLPTGGLWTHSAGVALAAQLFARRTGAPGRGLPFTAGLLHDIGKVVLDQFVHAEYAGIQRRVSEAGITFWEVEKQTLGYTHAETGAMLAERWHLPDAIVNSLRYHHEPAAQTTPDPVVDAVHLADVVCMVLGVGVGDDGLNYRADPEVLARYELTEADVDTIGAEAVMELRAVQALFSAK